MANRFWNHVSRLASRQRIVTPTINGNNDGIEDGFAAVAAEIDLAAADLASADQGKGAAMVAFKQNMLGAALQSVYLKLAGFVDLTDFAGADPSGTTNSCDAFRAAIAASKKIHIPAGTFVISPTIGSGSSMLYLGTLNGNTDRSGMTIIGDGDQSVIKIGNNVGASALLFGSNSADNLSNMTFKDFKIDLNGANNLQVNFTDPLRYNSAFYMHGKCTNFTFDNLHIVNGSGHQWIRVGDDTAANYGKNINIRNCHFENFGIGLPGNNLQDCSVCYIQADGIQAINNTFECQSFTFDLSRGHTALELHGDSSTHVVDNKFRHVQMPTLIASSAKSNSGVVIDGNNYYQCNYLASLDGSYYDQKQIKIINSQYYSTVVNPVIVPIGNSSEVSKARENIEFTNNTLVGWGNSNQGTHIFNFTSNYIRSFLAQDNNISGFNGSLMYMSGAVQNSGYADIAFKNNRLDSLGATSGSYPNSPAFIDIETSSGTINALIIDGTTLFNSGLKNYGTNGAFKLSGAITNTHVLGTTNNINAAYPLVVDSITGSTIKNIESSFERPVNYRTGPFTVGSGATVSLYSFSEGNGWGNNDFAQIQLRIWGGVGGTTNNGSTTYEVSHLSSADTATRLAYGGTYGSNLVVSFSGTTLQIQNTSGSSLSVYLAVSGFSTQPITWSA